MECGDEDGETVRVTITSTNAVVESYIAFGPGTDMENMDPAICIISLDKSYECKDFQSSANNIAPDRDTTDNGQNNVVFDTKTSSFNDTLKTATFNFTRPMIRSEELDLAFPLSTEAKFVWAYGVFSSSTINKHTERNVLTLDTKNICGAVSLMIKGLVLLGVASFI